ncbi:jouberin isoform X2 [Apis mellifera]|uniref:Jouberin isoform X2 n=1 Tax=Apis mellifera TaxID=7460 RepID=A0A7M7II50_APIME|nr:jouberin isoform X2 [Apis mellifera]|eukprot:XP_016770086.2 jouberin isoform X2 [Apis mellifera]
METMNLSEFSSKSMDVIVDIHQEYEEDKFSNDNDKQNETVDKNISNLQECENVNTSSNINIRDKKVKRSKINSTAHQNLLKYDNDIKIIESVDLIEEFEKSQIKKKNEKKIRTKDNKSNKKNRNRSFIEGKHDRKQWDISKNEIVEVKKPTRKRWLKDTTVIQLPEPRSISWTNTSPDNISSSVQHSKQSLSTACFSNQPLPAIRSSKQALTTNSFLKQELFGFDNAAFDSENEEILKIETNHNHDNTKIEMKFDGRSSQDLSKENKSLRETTIMIENLNETVNLDGRNYENQRKKTVLDIEHTEKSNYDMSLKDKISHKSKYKKNFSTDKNGKNISDNSNTSQSLQDITVQSDSSEKILIKNNQKCNRKHSIKNDQKHSEENLISVDEHDYLNRNYLKHSSQQSFTSEDDDLDENRSRKIYNEAKLKRSNMKKKKTNYTEQCQIQQKRKTHRKNISTSSMHTPVNVKENLKKKEKKEEKNIKYISVTIHRTDMLEIDYMTKHPMVKVHIIKENKSIIPIWEEELIFEHNFEELLKTDNEYVVILFEIIDLLSFAEASFNYDKFGHESCWYKIAWAFLKPIGYNNILHIDKKIRLQLYKPQKNLQKFERFHTCEVYTWWKSNIREKYPSSLFVTIKSIDPPKLEPVLYQQLSLHYLSNACNESQKIHTSDNINLPKWSRLTAQSCKVPNDIFFETDISENGCFYVAFSNNGKYLACSFVEDQDYPIVIYKVEAKKIHVRFLGHKIFVYSLHWSNNDNYLLSVSSDQTARIWDVQNQIIQHVEMMPHPSYVYCGKFESENTSIVATGCYDRIVRIWIQDKKLKNHDLNQELEGHEGFVNSMYFQKNSNLLTADSVGIIILWALKKNRKVSFKKEWHISRKIKVREIDGVIINTIILHPLESRLLVHSRNNGLKMLDLATGVILQKYNELNNQRIQSTACISPCGSLIFCGDEDSSLNVWNLETGNLIAKYAFDRHYRAITCVDYHPYDHMLAFSIFGSSAPVKILKFNKDATGENVGLKIREIENMVNNRNVSLEFLNTPVKSKEDLQSNNKEIIEDEDTVKEKNLLTNESSDSNLFKFPDNTPLERNKYNDTKIKLQQLNETGQTIKNRSANRLYNIIKKIDSILSNTSKSSGDIESGKNFVQELNKTKILTSLDENMEKQKNKLRKNTSISSDDQSSYFESSTTNSDKQKVIESYVSKNKINDWYIEKKLKNIKEMRNNDILKNYISESFSDSTSDYYKMKVYRESTKDLSQGDIESEHITEIEKSDEKLVKNNDSNSTDNKIHIVEKNDVKNCDEISLKMFENKNLVLDVTNIESNVDNYGSDCSIRSNATFIIECEVSTSK